MYPRVVGAVVAAILAAVEGARLRVVVAHARAFAHCKSRALDAPSRADKSARDESGDKSPHSKALAHSVFGDEFSPLLPQADWSACPGASSSAPGAWELELLWSLVFGVSLPTGSRIRKRTE